MKDSNKTDRLVYVDVTIEGNEDLSIRPWVGPSPLKMNPIEGAAASLSRENFNVLIVNDEDLTVRPWCQATPTLTGSDITPDPTEPQVEGAVSAHGVSQRLRVEMIDGVTVVSFIDTKIVTEENVQEVGDQLYCLVDNEGHRQLLLNFGNVQYLSPSALSKLVNLKRKVAAVKGRLKICCIYPDLLEVFRVSRLDQAFEIYKDERSALDES